MSERGRKESVAHKRQGIVPPRAPKKRKQHCEIYCSPEEIIRRQRNDEGLEEALKYVEPASDIPDGAQEMECYETESEIIVMYRSLEEMPEDHNCDYAGCGSLSHVKYRFNTARGCGNHST